MPVLSKRRKANLSAATAKPMPAAEAIASLRKFKTPKFDQTVNVVMHLGIDPKQADQIIRGSVSLPHGIGKSARVVCFCQSDKVAAAKAAGAVEAGAEDLVAKIEGGWMDFDVAVASPDMMRVVSKLGKVLGPKGLMPSPKSRHRRPRRHRRRARVLGRQAGVPQRRRRQRPRRHRQAQLPRPEARREPRGVRLQHPEDQARRVEGHLREEVRRRRVHEPRRAGHRLTRLRKDTS